MRVYQFRHIRADGQCSRAALLRAVTAPVRIPRNAASSSLSGSPSRRARFAVAAPACARADRASRSIVELDAPPLARAVVQSRALTTPQAAAAGRPRAARAARTGGPRRRAGAHRGAIERRPGRARALALPHRPQRLRRRRAGVAGSPRLRRVPGVARVCAERPLPLRSATAAPRRSARPRSGARADPRPRRQRDEDRDPRRRRRPDAPVLQPGRLRDTRRASRRGRRAYTTPKVIVARAFAPRRRRPGATPRQPFDPRELRARHARRRHRRRQPRRRPRRRAACTISGVAPRAYIGNYKVLTIPTPGSASTATRRRSPRGSRPPSPTAWT